MLAVSFQLLTWCTNSAGDLIYFFIYFFLFIPPNVNQDVQLLFPVLRMSLGLQKSVKVV